MYDPLGVLHPCNVNADNVIRCHSDVELILEFRRAILISSSSTAGRRDGIKLFGFPSILQPSLRLVASEAHHADAIARPRLRLAASPSVCSDLLRVFH